ncbi:hypothetical protein RUMHYD_02181 [Blautia hydrogenotrophica DSM 10507]|uniref:Uncharacterized protein n=1 Tax=Blautia hydrogenotrophica (strain DSM 10507 / JCM 14656 / S5a33) TaxID=476272 RepID=C0CMU3_BLAHS|nr:hypothetical protein RUMHYD_02181 [Blautia hydrogenotrophica DSM 10507]
MAQAVRKKRLAGLLQAIYHNIRSLLCQEAAAASSCKRSFLEEFLPEDGETKSPQCVIPRY